MKARAIRRRLNRERGGGREPWFRRDFRPVKRYARLLAIDGEQFDSGSVGRIESMRILVTDLYALSKDGDTYSWWEPADPVCWDMASKQATADAAWCGTGMLRIAIEGDRIAAQVVDPSEFKAT